MHADDLASPFVAMRKSGVEFQGIYTDSAFVQCDLDLQSLKAQRPYYTDKLAATTCIRVQSECLSTSLLYLCEQ